MLNVPKSFKRAGLVLAAAISAAGAGSAQAAVIFTTGATTSTGTENVRFTAPSQGVALGPGTTVTGKAGRTDYLVDFTANELLITFDQPGVTVPGLRATDGALRAINVGVQGGAFTTLVYNLHVDTVQGNAAGRFADILVTGFDGSTSTYRQSLRNGNNLLTLMSDDGALLRGVSISSGWNLVDLRQIRVGGLGEAPIPEPDILMSFSLAGLALWGVRARRRSGPRAKGGSFAQA